jgi:hypothetical protein
VTSTVSVPAIGSASAPVCSTMSSAFDDDTSAANVTSSELASPAAATPGAPRTDFGAVEGAVWAADIAASARSIQAVAA